jgi:hypothetical protein
MRRTAIALLSIATLLASSAGAMAFQTGKIYKSAEGEWMCIDKWGNEIPASSSGGWTVVTPPRQPGGDCNNQRVVATGGTVMQAQPLSATDLVAVPSTPPVTAKGITQSGIK